MNKIFEKEILRCVIPYLDGIIVYSGSLETHMRDLEIILGKLRAALFILKKKKCLFPRIEIMGS